MKNTTAIFWFGCLFSHALVSVYQDFLGMEKYIEKVKAGWVNTTPTFWLIVLIASVAGAMYHASKIKEEN